jgi:hypothetical protein
MTQPGLFDDANPTRATMTIDLSWNNGPFDESHVHILCMLGDRPVFQFRIATPVEEMDFSEALHVACREASRLVLGHRMTNSHIRRGRVVWGAPYQDDHWDDAS